MARADSPMQEQHGAGNRCAADIRCLLCGSVHHRPIFRESGGDIVRCAECGHIFSSFPADPHYDGFWGDDVQESDPFYWNGARARMHRDFFNRFLSGRSGRLLDMGCGLGFFVRSADSYDGWEPYGCEISPAAVRYARETLGLGRILCSRLEEINLPSEFFDIITMWDVLDHLRHPDAVLHRCHALLKQDGTLFIRTPNVAVQLLRARIKRLVPGSRSGRTHLMARDHSHHYSVKSIGKLLERNGFCAIEFLHLHPIGSPTATQDRFARALKNLCFQGVRALATASAGQLNFDNLFVAARKKVQAI